MSGRVRAGVRATGVAGGVLGTVLVSMAALGPVPAVAQSGAAAALAAVPEKVREPLLDGAAACPEVPLSIFAAQLQVASGFSASSTDGKAQGIAGLTPTTWEVWGSDADGDGVASPLDVADAIDAQARRLCWLYEVARDSTVRGDRLKLALAGYDAGWPNVESERGVPDGSRWYVERVLELSRSTFGRQTHVPFGDGEDVKLGLPLPVPNPRSVSSALEWARDHVGTGGWYQKCLNFTARAYGWEASGTPYAIDHFWEVPSRLRHPGDRNPPAGALLFWDTGSRPGHVAISLGDGMIVSNDIVTPGRISVAAATAPENVWGARYIGWTAPYYPEGSW